MENLEIECLFIRKTESNQKRSFLRLEASISFMMFVFFINFSA